MGRLWWLIVPGLVALIALLAYGLTSDPRNIPSPLIGKRFPQIKGLNLQGDAVVLGESNGRPQVINVWASWCVSCRAEHTVLLRGARRYASSVDIVGINYKDQLADAQRWLNRLGDPYAWSFQDLEGRTGIELGVYGVPETFFVNRQGVIVHKIAGPLTAESLGEGIAMITNLGSHFDARLHAVLIPRS
jgi:cytochrome c biogenesis protein CcmG/thiol:disulfide interchange protein DsbE